MENQMLCYQCETGSDCCNGDAGACGKSALSARLQDELTGALVGLARASIHKSVDEEIQWLMVEGLAATNAHTNFDDETLLGLTARIEAAKSKYLPKFGDYNTSIKIPENFDIRLIWQKSPDIRSLKSLLLFGIRGMATYAWQSWVLGYKNKEAATFFHKALIALGANHFKEDYFDLLKELGDVNLRAMALLTKANDEVYGVPGPVEVSKVIDAGPFIVVSGHSYHELEMILDQTADTGIHVYSHGELLTAHAYPKFQKYPHFKGHYGSGWQHQQLEFDNIPAAVVFTGNCMMMPLPSYIDRVFTAGTAHYPGVPHISDQDFRPVLIRAIELAGAPARIAFPGVNGGITVKTGFGKKTLKTLGYKIAGAMADKDINHIFVIGGCDGSGEDRQFFSDVLRRIPQDSVVFTYGCCKFRFNDMDNPEIAGVPRIVDAGQCGDLMTLVEGIENIANAAQCRVEDLPLTWILSWQEGRSIVNLFSLFAADVHNVILGPKRPPFFTAAVFDAFAKEFNVSVLMGEETVTEQVFEEEPEEPALIEEEAPAEEGPVYEEPITEATNEEAPPSPADLEERSEAAGLPDWAVTDDIEDEETEIAEEEPEAAKVRPEDIDQTPDFALADADDNEAEDGEEEEEEAVPAPVSVAELEERAEAAGLPDWAVSDDLEEADEAEATEPSLFDAETMAEAAATGAEKKPPAKTALPKGKGVSGLRDRENSFDFAPAPATELKEIAQPPKLKLPKGAGVSGIKDSETTLAAAKEQPYRYTPPQELKEVAPLPPLRLPKGAGVSGLKDSAEDVPATMPEPESEIPTPGAQTAKTEEVITAKPAIPKGRGVSGYHDPEETPAFRPGQKPYRYTPTEELKEITPPPPIALPEGAGVSGFSARTAPAEVSAPVQQNPYAFAGALPEIKIPKGAGVSGWKETDGALPGRKKKGEKAEGNAKPWLAQSLEALKASLDEDGEAAPVQAPEAAAETTPAPAPAPAEFPVPAAPAVEAAPDPLLSPEEQSAKPWLEASLQELKASLAEDESAKAAAGDKPWLAQSLQTLKASLAEDGEAPAAATPQEDVVDAATATPAPEEATEAWHKPPVQPKSWQDIVPAKPPLQAAPPVIAPQMQPQPQIQPAPAAEASGSEPDVPAWQKPPVTPKPWERDLQQTWQKPPVVSKPWQQQQTAMNPGAAPEPAPGVYTQLPNLPLGSPRANPVPPPAQPSPLNYIPRQQGPEIPDNAGVSGYRSAPYVPGQIPPAPVRELREVMPAPPAQIPNGAGVSGVRYHPDEPQLPTYDAAYYDVPQKTPRVYLPQGVGVSGWQDGGPVDPAEALRREAAARRQSSAFTANDLLAFTNSESRNSEKQETVYRPGEGEELIATLGPDGKVILAVRDKNNKG